MQFKGSIFYPKGYPAVQTKLLSIPSEIETKLYSQFKANMKKSASWKFEFSIAKDLTPLTVGFGKIGQTAGHIALLHEAPSQRTAVHGFVALLQGLDETDDAQAIELIRHAPTLRNIDAKHFDLAISQERPHAATFYTSGPSDYQAFVNTTVKLVAAAFFDMFGTAEEISQ
jgi:hypothetical protein